MAATPADGHLPPARGPAFALIAATLGVSSLFGNACSPRRESPSREARTAAAREAVARLRAGSFEEAAKEAGTVLAEDEGNAQARLVAAIAEYHRTMHEFRRVLLADVWTGLVNRGFSVDAHKVMREALGKVDGGLGEVARHLAVAARDEEVALELCLASWERDWNHNGRIDESDRLLFQIEIDADGSRIPEGDPRRKPTFRFDVGDVHWAQAMVAFQRSLVNIVLAYRWTEIDKLFRSSRLDDMVITIRLEDRDRIGTARELVLAGLQHADKARTAYLVETDDRGEWVPNPSQKDHPLPLPVDEALYETWEGVLGDLRRMLQGEEGISVAEIAQLGDHKWEKPPQGYIDVRRLTVDPGDIVFDFTHLNALVVRDTSRDAAETVLADIFGDKYVTEMKPSPLVKRLVRMKGELERGEESLERKLRYFLWLN